MKTEKKILIIAILLFVISALFFTATLVMRNVESDSSGKNADSVTDSPNSDGVLKTSEKEETEDNNYNDDGNVDSLTYTLDSDGLLIIGGKGKMDDYNYDSQSPWYNSREEIKKVVILDGVTSIGDNAFYDCSSLTSIEIPNSVTNIGHYAFYNCSSLTSIEIPNAVTSIGSHAFMYCSSLISIKIPNSVTNIGVQAFSHCDSLTEIAVSKDNPNYSSDEYGVLFNKEKTELIVCPWGFTETSYIIPNSVTNIGNEAFNGCSSLKNIEIPNGVTNIDGFAFWSCSGLTSIKIPNSVTSIGACAFSDCSSLTSVEIPNSITKIEKGTFDECLNLEDVYFHGSADEWDRISIGDGNEFLKYATVHFIYYDFGNVSDKAD